MQWAKTNISRGFTIVELLIVVVVIAILAAITIVSYNGITRSAHDTTIKSDIANLKKKVELFRAENGRRPNSIEFPIMANGFKASKGSYATQPTTDHNLIYCGSTNDTDYAIVSYSKSGKKFRISNNSSVEEYTTAWTTQTVACQDAMSNYGFNYRGYAAEDTTDGPWRAWAGGN